MCGAEVLSLLEACFDLISSPSLSMKIQIMGGKIAENLRLNQLLNNKIVTTKFSILNGI